MIGGKFGLEPVSVARPKLSLLDLLPSGTRHLYVNARSALGELVRFLEPSKVWFPSYYCRSMLQWLGKYKRDIGFYPVNGTLEYAPDERNIAFGKRDLVVAIEYFGFPASPLLYSHCQAAGSTVLVDACQALLSGRENDKDKFYLFSLRKFYGTPDGGILIGPINVCNHNRMDTLKQLPEEWLRETFEGLKLRRDFEAGKSCSRQWFEILQESERSMPCGNYSISEFSRDLIEGGLDISNTITKRRRNFQLLADQLKPWAIYPDLPKSVVPIGFPVAIKNRDHVQKQLFAREIYPPIHWSLDGLGVKGYRESYALSRKILTLPCDQRYNESDMCFLAQSFASVAARWTCQ